MALIVHHLHVGNIGGSVGASALTVREADNVPQVFDVNLITFEDGALSVDGVGANEIKVVIPQGTVGLITGGIPVSQEVGVLDVLFPNCFVTGPTQGVASVNAVGQKSGLSFPSDDTQLAVWQNNGSLGRSTGPGGIRANASDDVFMEGIGALQLHQLTTTERDAHGFGNPGQVIYNETVERIEFNTLLSAHYWQGLAVAPDGVVIVNTLDDLPAPVSDVITLEAKFYLFSNFINLGVANSIRWGQCKGLIGLDRDTSGIDGGDTSLPTISALAGDSPLYIENMRFFTFGSPGAVGIAYDATTTAYIKRCSAVGQNTPWRVDGAAFTLLDSTSFVTQGIVLFTDVVDLGPVKIEDTMFSSYNGAAIEFGAVEVNGDIRIRSNTNDQDSGDIFLGGQSDGSNIVSGRSALVSGNTIFGGDTLSDIDPATAIGWYFQGNKSTQGDLLDNNPTAALYVLTNATETVIAVAGTFVDFGLTHTAGDLVKFTHGTDGLLTYDEAEKVKVAIDAQVRLEPVAAGAQTLSIEIVKNGTRIPGTLASHAFAGTGIPSIVSIQWEDLLDQDDTLQMRVANESGTGNITADQITFRVRAL